MWTVHNETPHERGSKVESRLLHAWSRAVRQRVFLYPSVTPDERSATFIPFGDYSHVAGSFPATGGERSQNRMLLFGLLRPYKGIEQLIEAFSSLRPDAEAQLAIVGRPTDRAYSLEVSSLVERSAGIEFRPELLDYEELVGEIRHSALVVLPYRRMYNSGAALLSLSCGTPILVPSSPTMDDLRVEAGEDWVFTYEGEITPDVLMNALEHFRLSAPARASRDPLPRRSWTAVAAEYASLYEASMARRR